MKTLSLSFLRSLAALVLCLLCSRVAIAQTPTPTPFAVADIFYDKADADYETVKNSAKSQSTSTPFYKSNGLETRTYEGFFKAASDNSKLALLSDDGTSGWIAGTQVLDRAGQGQGFENFDSTFYPLSSSFKAGQVYKIRLVYTNTVHRDDADVDGLTLFAYDGGGTIVDSPVTVEKLQYRLAPEGTWQDVPETLYLPVESAVEFKALKQPTNIEWPEGTPSWSSSGAGVTGATGVGETKAVTFSQVSSSASDAKTVTASSGNSKTAKVVVYSVSISASGLTQTQKTTIGASVALNDDFDNGAVADYSSPSGYRIGEPIMDRDRNQSTPQEDDLLPITLSVAPSGLPGQAQLSGGGLEIYLWPSAQKGSLGQIISLPKIYNLTELPKTVYVEGKYTGATSLTLSSTLDGGAGSDTLNVNVVTLVESQGSHRRVINNYNEVMEFKVVGGSDAAEYRWDLDGDGTYGSSDFEENVSTRTKTISYGPAKAAKTVLLPRDDVHKRWNYNVSVKLTGGLVLTRPIHVALDAFYGTPLTGVTVAERQAEITTIGSAIGTFDNVPLNIAPAGQNSTEASQEYWEEFYNIPLDINSGHRLQYAPGLLESDGSAVTVMNFPGNPGALRKIYFIAISDDYYDSQPRQMREDVALTIAHENLHVAQFSASRDNPQSIWRKLDVFYNGDLRRLTPLVEAPGHLLEVNSSSAGWYHLRGERQDDVRKFHKFYNDALNKSLSEILLTAPNTHSEVREMMRGMYNSITSDLSPQMKTYGWVNGYDYAVRPPL